MDEATWEAASADLADGRATLLALWGDTSGATPFVHLAALRTDLTPMVLSLNVAGGHFPSVGRLNPAAIRPERAVFDLHGLVADGAPDPRPWLDHGRWPHSRSPAGYRFLSAEGAALHQIPVGSVHAGTIEPGHFRFTVQGETIVRLEARLGYAHKGTLALMRGATPDHAARLAGRLSGDSTVAYAFAFFRAVECATFTDVPPRPTSWRGVMAELERIANHLGDVGAICNDAGFALMNAHCAVLRERMLRLARHCFGHRLMMDRIVPGGIAGGPVPDAPDAIRRELEFLERRFARLVELYDKTASLQDRVVGAGRLSPDMACRLGCGGYVGRASGRDFDARRDVPYPPYLGLATNVPCLDAGDVDARIRVRVAEITESARAIRALLCDLPAGDISAVLNSADGWGNSIREGFRGDIFAECRMAGGRVANVFLRDPSWFAWPALEAAIEGNIVADFPLCNKSFNCAYSGHDL